LAFTSGNGTDLKIDQTFITSAWGYLPTGTLYPNALSGGQVTTFMDSYTRFSSLSNTVNQSPLISMSTGCHGGLSVMCANAVPDEDLATVVGVAPAAIAAVNTDSGNPVVADIPADIVVSGMMLTPSEAGSAVLLNCSSVLSGATGTTNAREYRVSLKIALVNGSGFPTSPPTLAQPIAAPFSVNVPMGSGLGSFVNAIMNETFRPSSPFALGLRQFEDKHPKMFAHLKNVATNPDVQDYANQVLRGLMSQMFNNKTTTSPPIDGKIDYEGAGPVQTMMSRGGTVSRDTSGSSLLGKIAKHGFTAAKLIGKALLDSATSTGDASAKNSPITGFAKDMLKFL